MTRQSPVDVCLLLDFYGQLLTERVRATLEWYFGNDLSLAEIAEQQQVSRQAVHDRIKQGLRSLDRYEAKLGLIARFRQQKTCIEEAIRDIEAGHDEIAREKLLQLNGLL
ncbi:MAG: sigma factor-like helix-turn-helix DNA-binding protein [Clostridiaceae bacterium]|nr:sigma factor-like helix-turn-helix DNA-binding protein [Clostridiaceae bacterium]